MTDKYEEQTKQMDNLLSNIKENLPELETLLSDISGHWQYEDLIYRYYHHSFKVYWIQQHTEEMVALFLKLSPNEKGLNNKFVEIFEMGKDKTFKMEDNQNWNEVCAPMVEAFLHAKFFLEMIVKYGKEYDESPDMLDSGWAAVLILYGLR